MSLSQSHVTQIKDYILEKDIGEGNFGKVKLGISKTTKEEYAIKIINKGQIKIKMKNKIFKENEVITKFNHINVIFVFEILEDPENYYIIMEYCKRGELFDYIVDHERLTQDEASMFFYQLINGVEYIHSKGVAHRDLKPENLLLTKDKTLKIIDFGLSHDFNGTELLKTKCGSPSYASPEILKGKPYDGFKTDVWSCGIILFAMVCGYLPFDGDNNKILFKNIIKCEPEIPEFLDESTQELIKRILTADPERRITIDEIKKHKFYLRGKQLCHIDYKMIEKNVLKKRKNKSSFRLNEDDNTYFIFEDEENNSINVNSSEINNKREEQLINEIINENINDKKSKSIDKHIEKPIDDCSSERRYKKSQQKAINNYIRQEYDNNYKEKENNIRINNSTNKTISLREILLNNNKGNINKEMDAIFCSKRLNNGNININTINNLNVIDINDITKERNEKIITQNNKSNKLNKFLQNFGKNLKINTDIDNKQLMLKELENKKINNFMPTMTHKDTNDTLNSYSNDNSLFTKIKNSFIKTNTINKHNTLLNFGKIKNDNFSIQHNNDNFENNEHYYNNNKNNNNYLNNDINNYNNKFYNNNKLRNDILSSNSIHHIKLVNTKQSVKDNNNLLYNYINININNYNIKTGNNNINKKNNNYINNDPHTNLNINLENLNKNILNSQYNNYNRNSTKIIYANTINDKKDNKINKKRSIGNLHMSNQLYTNNDNLLNEKKINDYNDKFSSLYNNNTDRDGKFSFQTHQNFFKSRKLFNFDKISFHSSSNKKAVFKGKNNLRFKDRDAIDFNINNIENFKKRGGSEGRAINHSNLDKLLYTINQKEYYKNKNRKGNQKLYFFNPINIKVSSNNYNINSYNQQYLPIMSKKNTRK